MRARRTRIRGSILVLALLASAAASITGMWLITTSDLRARSNRFLLVAGEASRVAMSGLQYARIQLDGNMGWAGAQIENPDEEWGGSMQISCEPLAWARSQVSVTGVLGSSTQAVHASLRAVVHPTLHHNFASATGVTLRDAVLSGHVRANGAVDCIGNVDFAGVVTTLSGSSVSEQIDAGQVIFDDDALPPPTVSLAAYQSLSSTMLGVPHREAGGPLLLDRVWLSPTHNPYGPTNAQGAYVLDAEGFDVVIRDLYLRGTLTIINTGTVSTERGLHAERVDAALATLVVSGALDVRLENDLNETYLLLDLNCDGDFLDIFAAEISGIVYATGKFTGTRGGNVNGAVIANSIEIVGSCNVSDCPPLLTQPVHGFVEPGPWEIVVGSIGSGA